MAAGSFGHGHEAAPGGVEDDAVGFAVHGECLLKIGGECEACNVAGGFDVLGMADGLACKYIELHWPNSASQTQHVARELLAWQLRCAWA